MIFFFGLYQIIIYLQQISTLTTPTCNSPPFSLCKPLKPDNEANIKCQRFIHFLPDQKCISRLRMWGILCPSASKLHVAHYGATRATWNVTTSQGNLCGLAICGAARPLLIYTNGIACWDAQGILYSGYMF